MGAASPQRPCTPAAQEEECAWDGSGLEEKAAGAEEGSQDRGGETRACSPRQASRDAAAAIKAAGRMADAVAAVEKLAAAQPNMAVQLYGNAVGVVAAALEGTPDGSGQILAQLLELQIAVYKETNPAGLGEALVASLQQLGAADSSGHQGGGTAGDGGLPQGARARGDCGRPPQAKHAAAAAAGGSAAKRANEPAAGGEPPAKQARHAAAAVGSAAKRVNEPAAGEEPPAKQARHAAAAADAESDDEGEVCCKCKPARDSGNMLLCGPAEHTCSFACHIGCMDPPLESLPTGDWFCPECTSRQAAAAEFVKVGNIVLLRLDPSTLKRGWDICGVTGVDGKGGFSGVYLMPQVHGSGSCGQQAADWPEGWEEGDLVEMMAGKKPWKFMFNKLEAGVAACWGSKLEQHGGGKKWRMASSDAAGLKGAIANLAAAEPAEAPAEATAWPMALPAVATGPTRTHAGVVGAAGVLAATVEPQAVEAAAVHAAAPAAAAAGVTGVAALQAVEGCTLVELWTSQSMKQMVRVLAAVAPGEEVKSGTTVRVRAVKAMTGHSPSTCEPLKKLVGAVLGGVPLRLPAHEAVAGSKLPGRTSWCRLGFNDARLKVVRETGWSSAQQL